MSKHRWPKASRRNFLKGAGFVGAAAAVTPSVVANAMPAAQSEKLMAAPPGPRQIAAETMPPPHDPVNQTSSGGDFMTDVLNSLGIEYMAINCASSYRGLHEAIINHGDNKPEIITCVHEDIAAHMAQGYAKIEGKPLAMACHGTVGLQHAVMAMYNALVRSRADHRFRRQYHGCRQARAWRRMGAFGGRHWPARPRLH